MKDMGQNQRDMQMVWRPFLLTQVLLLTGVLARAQELALDDGWMRPTLPTKEARAGNPLARFQDWLDEHPLPNKGLIEQVADSDQSWEASAAQEVLRTCVQHWKQFDRLLATNGSTWLWRESPRVGDYEKAPGFQTLPSIASLMVIRSRAASNAREAVQQAVALDRCAGFLSRAQGSLVHLVVSSAIRGQALTALEFALKRADATEALLARSQSALNGPALRSQDMAFTLRVEYGMFRALLVATASQEAIKDTALIGLPEIALRRYARIQGPVLRALDAGWKNVPPVLAQYQKDVKALAAEDNKVQPGMFGLTLLKVSLTASSDALAGVHDTNALRALARLQIALRRHELAQGVLPDSLDQLQSLVTEEELSDPWSQSRLIWRSDSRTLYSVGQDGADNGGDSESDVAEVYWWAKPTNP